MKKALKKALFIDRDGTLIVEPPVDMQVDSLAKLEFVPGAISALKVLRGLDFELVMATNQDGLGTDSFPEEDFRIPQEKMLRTLAGEGVLFDDMLIAFSYTHLRAHENKANLVCRLLVEKKKKKTLSYQHGRRVQKNAEEN